MSIEKLKLNDAFVYIPRVFEDNRGWFMESYNIDKFPNPSVCYIQENHSYSKEKGTIRGLHIQLPPYTQSKLIRCIRGELLDVIVDIRKDSSTYLQVEKIVLSEKNKKVLFVPRGFLHGFLTLTDDVEVIYKVDNVYNRESERSVLYSDPLFKMEWGIDNPIVSEKDKLAPLYFESDVQNAKF